MYRKIKVDKNNTIVIDGSKGVEYLPLRISIPAEILHS
jgi:hypothetical protein